MLSKIKRSKQFTMEYFTWTNKFDVPNDQLLGHNFSGSDNFNILVCVTISSWA